MASCVAVFSGEGVEGFVTLKQATEDHPTIIEGEVKGLKEVSRLGR